MLFYYIEPESKVEEFDAYYNTIIRKGVRLRHEDYPRHRYDSEKYVFYMQLFTKAEIDRCLALSEHKYSFQTIELDKEDTFIDHMSKCRYSIAYEREHDTQAWKDNKHRIKDKKQNEKDKLRKSWLQIYAILKETGYADMYEEDITRVATLVRKELGLD